MSGQPQGLGPLEREPGRVRPPFDGPWERFDQQPGETVDSWQQRLHADRTNALLEPLEGIELGAYDLRIIEWLGTGESGTVATIASWIYRARAAGGER